MDNLELILTEELQQEFLDYLKEDPEFESLESLNEEVLTEGKLLNKIRWKLALFSLRFLKESSINDFLKAYYSDKDGKETEKSKEWVAKKKKEKLAKMRELANGMKQEEKDKVANSEAARKLEKSAVISGVIAGAAGIGTAAAYSATRATNSAIKNVQQASSSNNLGFTDNTWSNNEFYVDSDGVRHSVGDKNNLKDIAAKGHITYNENDPTKEEIVKTLSDKASTDLRKWDRIDSALTVATSILSILAAGLFGAMWGSLIIAGVSAARGLRQAHKANVVRRDEIMSELLKNKDTRDLKECLEFLNGDIESQKTLIEMYQSGDYEFYNAVNNIYQQKLLKEDFSKYNKK